ARRVKHLTDSTVVIARRAQYLSSAIVHIAQPTRFSVTQH
ncbi:MAG: hypothetical protein RIQ94_894, partial [Pseudomonadota bacterium]